MPKETSLKRTPKSTMFEDGTRTKRAGLMIIRAMN